MKRLQQKILTAILFLFCLSLSAQKTKAADAYAYQFADAPSLEVSQVLEKNDSKIIRRANEYFDKMWYAEAAKLYEEALKDKSNHTLPILQKAGDSHYLNTNMERAHHWYSLLNDKFKKDMSSDNIFKYAHTVKSSGRYGRAKRLMRLYHKKLDDEKLSGNYKSSDERNDEMLNALVESKPDFEIKNLAINSKQSDFAPMFHNKNQVVFSSAVDSSFLVTRRYKWNNQPYLDLYVSNVKNGSQDLKNPKKLSKTVNTKYHEASVSFSPDNKTMYFTRNNYGKKLKRSQNGENNLKIYKSTKVDGEWSIAEELPFNSDDYSTGHPAISPDGKKLYFVSDMPGSLGETDLFVVDVNEDGTYSDPKNLGPKINTEQKEMFPFINREKLYFSSNGHVGLGGLDIYEVAYNAEGFQEVKNVGKPINSRKDDFSYIVKEDTQEGYFASNRAGGKGDDDIYSFKRLLVEEVNENAIAGVVTELLTGDFMPQALVTLLDENNIKVQETITDENGSFLFEELDSDSKYTVKTVKTDFREDEKLVITKVNETVETNVHLNRLHELILVDNGVKKFKMDKVYFDFDKSALRTDAASELDKIVEVMKVYPKMVVKVESHTDAIGKKAYNKFLSDKRAKSTRDYLISKGIDENRIESAIGYGEEKLINECKDGVPCKKALHEHNRRSEIIIVAM